MTLAPPDDLGNAGASIFAGRHWVKEQAPCATPKPHGFASLALCTAGQWQMEQGGRWTLGAGDVLLVPAGEPHRLVEARRPEIWGLGVHRSCFAPDEADRVLEPFERVRAGASAVVRIPSERQPFVEGLFRELADACSAPRRSEAHAVRQSLLILVLNEVQRAARWDVDPEPTKGVVAESLAFIERNCLRPLTLNEVARAVRRTPAYVTTSLTRATGRSAVQWIIAGRMAEARRLLMRSDERIDVVAERVGYADATHFIRLFQRAHGATPSAWRAVQSRSRYAPPED